MPTTDKYSKKVVSTTIIDGEPSLNDDKFYIKTVDTLEEELSLDVTESNKKEEHYKIEYVWRNISFFIFMHLCIPYAFYMGLRDKKYHLFLWHTWIGYTAGLGVTAGAHRLWSHQSYKAHWTVRVFLAFWFTVAGQNDIYEWCRDHRVHHKWSETDADPHNVNRGFFFAHMGWLCCRKHKLVFEKGQTLDFSDLLQDPIVRFHKKYYKFLYLLCVYLIPTYLTVLIFNESWLDAFAQSIVRYCLSLHITWLVNSAAHLWGNRPYNDKIGSAESPLAIYLNVLGEGYHNYHHSFPFDYRSSEYGYFFQLNAACLFIDLIAKLGLAWDLRKASDKVVQSSKLKVRENELLREKALLIGKELMDNDELKGKIVKEKIIIKSTKVHKE